MLLAQRKPSLHNAKRSAESLHHSVTKKVTVGAYATVTKTAKRRIAITTTLPAPRATNTNTYSMCSCLFLRTVLTVFLQSTPRPSLKLLQSLLLPLSRLKMSVAARPIPQRPSPAQTLQVMMMVQTPTSESQSSSAFDCS